MRGCMPALFRGHRTLAIDLVLSNKGIDARYYMFLFVVGTEYDGLR